MKTFTLKLKITGVCLITPSRNGEKGLYVLMPTGLQKGDVGVGHGRHERGDRGVGQGATQGEELHVPAHVARILFHEGHCVQGCTGLEVRPDSRLGVPLEGQSLLLPHLDAKDEFDPPAPSTFWDITRQTRPRSKKLKKRLFERKTSSPDLLSRVFIPLGRQDEPSRGAIWKIVQDGAEHYQEMALTLNWVVRDVKGDTLDLELRTLKKDELTRTIELKPINGEILLEIWHTPEDELGRPPSYDASGHVSAHHMKHLYDFFGRYVPEHGRKPLPEFHKIPDDLSPSGSSEGEPIAGSRITCFPAVADGDIDDGGDGEE